MYVPIGNVVNNGTLSTSGGNSVLDIEGSLTNNRSAYGGSFEVGSSDTAYLVWLTNNADVKVDTGGTLYLVNGVQPGIRHIPANSGFTILGTFSQTYNTSNPSAFYNLTSIEGYLRLGNGQTTDITPTSGNTTLTNSGDLTIDSGSMLNIHGTLTNSGLLSTFSLSDPGTVVNLDNLDIQNDQGSVSIGTGSTLFLLKQPSGITTIPAVFQFTLDGACYAGANTSAPNCFSMLDTINGALTIDNGQTIQDNPSSGTLTIASSGSLTVLNGSTFKVHSIIVGLKGANIYTDPSSLIIEGTLYNYGANITVDGNSVFSVGTVVNGGPLMLTHNAGITVNNGFYQLASGTLGASIDATGFTIVTVNGGPVVLDGTLDVLLGPNFNPTIGSFYKFLLFGPGELSGVFGEHPERVLQ